MSAQKRTVSGALGGFLGFVGMSAVAGILVTAAVTPALALTGITATSSINMFENLPSYLDIKEPAQRSDILVNSGGTWSVAATYYEENREEVAWDQVAQVVKDAAIAGEDPRFYEHGGVDLQGTLRAAVKTLTTSDTQGGSTITQQYVKNALVQKGVLEATTDEEKQAAYDSATETTPDRKLREMRYAIGLEKEYTKDEILLGYLNIALFGGTVYGIEAAAQYYFGATAATLTLPQAATLLAMVNNPSNLRIDQPENEVNGAADGYAETLGRRDYILDEMVKYNKITEEEHAAAIELPITPVITEPSTGCQTASYLGMGYFCDYVVSVIKSDPAFGDTEEARETNLRRGGYQIYTTIDLDIQAAAQTAINDTVPNYVEGIDVGTTSVSVEVGTGRVLSMAQNRVYSQDPEVTATSPSYSGINLNADFAHGGSSGFQPGSTYKIFTLAEWLKEGHSLNEGVDARRRAAWGNFTNTCQGDMNDGGEWGNPKNDDGENGGFWTAAQSTKFSYNTGFIAMAKKLDLCGIATVAKDLGVVRADGLPLEQFPSTILGTNEVAPMSMATAFAGIANNGMSCSPIAIDRILNSDGADVEVPKSTCKQALEPDVAAATALGMAGTFNGGTTSQSGSRTDPWVPMIGKTGTSDNNEATWMMGSSTKVATVVGVFNASGHVNLRNFEINGTQAAVIRHDIWPRVQSVANAKYGGDDFAEVSSNFINAPQANVPDVRGMTLDAAKTAIEDAGFGFVDGGQVDSALPAGQVTGSNPTGSASRGSIVTVTTSKGTLVVLPSVVGQDQAAAKSALEAAGFKVQISQSAGEKGKVLSQSPAGGAEVKAGSVIKLVVGKAGAASDDGEGGD